MKDETQAIEAIFQQTAVLKSYKEHYEKESQKFIQYFGDQVRFTDPLRLAGWRFQERNRQWKKIQNDNNDLRLRTRDLQKQLQQLRISLRNSGYRDGDISNISGRDWQQKITTNKTVSRTQGLSGNEDLMAIMKDISVLKGQARNDYIEYKQKFEQLLEYVFKSIDKLMSAVQLKSQMRPASAELQSNDSNHNEMILVPRKRYQKLIQIYSINMAEITANELKSKLKDQIKINQKINYIQNQKIVYRQSYSDIAKDPLADIKDLQTFFRVFARKFGFENQWDRYHQHNINQAIALKGKIEAIKNQYKPTDNQEIQHIKFSFQIDGFMKLLLTNKAEKQNWQKINQKIRDDQLINMEKVLSKIQQMEKQKEDNLLKNIAQLGKSIIQNCCQLLQKLFSRRFRKQKIVNINQIKECLEIDKLVVDLTHILKGERQGKEWQIGSEIMKKRINEIFKIVQNSVVFVSNGQIYRNTLNQK